MGRVNVDIKHYSDWPLKVENEKKVLESEMNQEPFNRGMPLKTTITTTTDCNLKCKGCRYHGQIKTPKKELPFHIFEKVAHELFPYIKELHPTVEGEPFMTSYFDKIIPLLKEYGVKLNLTTNGVFLDEENINLILPVLRDIKISFDGSNQDTFGRIRSGAKLETIVKNIENFIMLRDKYMQGNSYNSVYRPEITIQSVLQKSNIIELPKIAEIAGQLGVDRIKGFNLTISDPDFLNESLLFNQELSNEYLQKTKEVAKKYNLETKYQDPFDLNLDVFDIRDNVVLKRLEGTSCDFLWRQFNVGVEGEVKPCCHPNSPVLGNVYNNTVREIWNNRNYTKMRERFNSHNPLKCCIHCAMRSTKVLDASAFIDESIL